MAKLSEEELERIRRQHGIKPEHIGRTPMDKRVKPNGKKAPECPEWLYRALG